MSRGEGVEAAVLLAVSLVCSACYIETLEGDFAYDDGAAIVKNKDVNGNNSNAYTDIWSHDFWGQDLRNESSHKSYRPLTTLSFKWQYEHFKGKPRAFHIFNVACHIVVTTLVGVVMSNISDTQRRPLEARARPRERAGSRGTPDRGEGAVGEVDVNGSHETRGGDEEFCEGSRGGNRSKKHVKFALPNDDSTPPLDAKVSMKAHPRASSPTAAASRGSREGEAAGVPQDGVGDRSTGCRGGVDGGGRSVEGAGRREGGEQHDKLSARLCCALFATHPVHVEAVANVVSRAELLSAAFYLASFLCYRRCLSRAGGGATLGRGGGTGWFLSACMMFVAGVLCKESVLTAVGLFAAEELLSAWRDVLPAAGAAGGGGSTGGGGAREMLGRIAQRGGATRLCALALICAGYLRAKAQLAGEHFLPKVAPIDNSAVNAPTSLGIALSVLQVHAAYLGLLLAPVTLSCDSSLNVLPNILSATDPANARWLAAYTALLALALFALRRARRGDDEVLRYLLWLLVPFALSANLLFPVATVVGERLLYLPSAGFCMLLSWFLADRSSPLSAMLSRAGSTGAGVGLAALYAARSFHRVPVWHDTLRLFEAHVEIVPTSVRMQHGLALELARQSKHQQAGVRFRKALELLEDPRLRGGIGKLELLDEMRAQYSFEAANSLSELGSVSAKDEAEALYRKAVSLAPGEYAYQNRLAFNLVQKRNYREGFTHFLACFELRPTNADMVNNLANIYMATNQVDAALRAYKLGQRLNPTDADNLYNMGALLLRTGPAPRAREAFVALRAARRLAPSDEQVRNALRYSASLLGQEGGGGGGGGGGGADRRAKSGSKKSRLRGKAGKRGV